MPCKFQQLHLLDIHSGITFYMDLEDIHEIIKWYVHAYFHLLIAHNIELGSFLQQTGSTTLKMLILLTD